jgi:hypothetical protein
MTRPGALLIQLPVSRTGRSGSPDRNVIDTIVQWIHLRPSGLIGLVSGWKENES